MYQLTGGRIGARLAGWEILLLTTRGRKSGEPRSVTLNFLRDGTAMVVIASNAGDDRDPLWWRNLKSNPDAEVRVGTKRSRVHAREAEATERELLWDKVVARDVSYAEYEQRTRRRIPVVVLEPSAG
ncbi:MAG: nitroreductase family deazaflavin-dependent oxidoreductase [Chloroflexota bacterium]|nr:nitroreductase family deazaflavin-dependent oxidoreductase [Chloroflexota bacterium]